MNSQINIKQSKILRNKAFKNSNQCKYSFSTALKAILKNVLCSLVLQILSHHFFPFFLFLRGIPISPRIAFYWKPKVFIGQPAILFFFPLADARKGEKEWVLFYFSLSSLAILGAETCKSGAARFYFVFGLLERNGREGGSQVFVLRFSFERQMRRAPQTVLSWALGFETIRFKSQKGNTQSHQPFSRFKYQSINHWINQWISLPLDAYLNILNK